jgi:hypothetical protein
MRRGLHDAVIPHRGIGLNDFGQEFDHGADARGQVTA